MDYDAAWKRLFGLPILVEHLLLGFVAPAAKWLGFSSLRELSASWAGADSQQRHGDAVWRVDYGEKPGRSLVLPYSYLSLDVRRLAQHHLPSRNIVSMIFKLDALESPAKIVPHMRELSEWLPREVGPATADTVFATILEWLASMAPRMFPGSGATLVVAKLQQEVRERENSMALLAERAKQWEAEWLQEGVEQGLAQERELLRRQAEQKFDPATAEELARRLAAVTDAERLAEVGCRIIDCGTGAELLRRTDSS